MEESVLVQFPLLQLPKDLLQEFLMACDPEDALTMEKTCKTIYLLSDSKHLWLTLLAKLDYDHSPDVGPHVDLDSLQATEIKRIVIRALKSYNNWCCPDGPRITRELKIQLESHQYVAVMVLPGCQYLIVQTRTDDYLGVWDIKRETLAARYPCQRRIDHQYIAHDCALLKGGKIARFAYVRNESPETLDHIEVVDFDLHRGHATLLFSKSIGNVRPVYSLKVRDEALLIGCDSDFALLIPDTGKIARLTVGIFDVDFDIVRGSLIFVTEVIYGSALFFVAKLSRIFEHTQATKAIPLEDICEICRGLTFTQPYVTGHTQYTLTVCDPAGWGSARPCRILLAHIDFRSSIDQSNKMVQVHRLYLEESHNGLDLMLTNDSSSNCVPLEESIDRTLVPRQRPSKSGRWMLSGGRGKGKYDIMVHQLWEDDVRLPPSDNPLPSVIWAESEHFSGTQIFCLEDGSCILHFFD